MTEQTAISASATPMPGPRLAVETLKHFLATGRYGPIFVASEAAQHQILLTLCNEVRGLPGGMGALAKCAIPPSVLPSGPAFIVAYLHRRERRSGRHDFENLFRRVIVDGPSLEAFCRVIRSGILGSNSFSPVIRTAVTAWFSGRTVKEIFRQAPRMQDPSMADVLKLLHVRPSDQRRDALFKFLLGREFDSTQLTAMSTDWREIAHAANWRTLFELLHILNDRDLLSDDVTYIAHRIGAVEEIRQARAMPFEIFNCRSGSFPHSIRDALNTACDRAIDNVEVPSGKVFAFVDVTRGMTELYPAAAVLSALLRKNTAARAWPFSSHVRSTELTGDSVLGLAAKLGSFAGLVPSCSAPLAFTSAHLGEKPETVVIISGVNALFDQVVIGEWRRIKSLLPSIKLVLVNLAENEFVPREFVEPDVLFVSGFNDQAFTAIAEFSAR